jgi:hypothetical protein
MSILLYLPALLVVLFKRSGLLATSRHMITLIASNALLALPFLEEDYWAYLRSAFDLSRVFLYKWTVNWRMLGEETFLSPQWANGLLLGHISVLAAFGLFVWCKKDGGVWVVLKYGIRKPDIPAGFVPVTADCKFNLFLGRLFSYLVRYRHDILHVEFNRHHICTVTSLPVLLLVCATTSLLSLEDTIPRLCQVGFLN